MCVLGSESCNASDQGQESRNLLHTHKFVVEKVSFYMSLLWWLNKHVSDYFFVEKKDWEETSVKKWGNPWNIWTQLVTLSFLYSCLYVFVFFSAVMHSAGIRTGPAVATMPDSRRQGLPGAGPSLSSRHRLLLPLCRGSDRAGERSEGCLAESPCASRELGETLQGAGHRGNNQHNHRGMS